MKSLSGKMLLEMVKGYIINKDSVNGVKLRYFTRNYAEFLKLYTRGLILNICFYFQEYSHNFANDTNFVLSVYSWKH